eukprot:m.349366 g.349366  ORF g.349366 m.349366 type:complete len:359 (+) comp27950_c0_seq9:219-1295(+)
MSYAPLPRGGDPQPLSVPQEPTRASLSGARPTGQHQEWAHAQPPVPPSGPPGPPQGSHVGNQAVAPHAQQPPSWDQSAQPTETESIPSDFFMSHTQRNGVATTLATDLHSSLRDVGLSVWFDVKMPDHSSSAMKGGVQSSTCLIAVITGPCSNPDFPDDPPELNAYFARPACVAELRWAQEAGVKIQPVIRSVDKPRIQELMSQAPADLQFIAETDFITFDRTDKDYWDVGVHKLLKAAGKVPRNISSGATAHYQAHPPRYQSPPIRGPTFVPYVTAQRAPQHMVTVSETQPLMGGHGGSYGMHNPDDFTNRAAAMRSASASERQGIQFRQAVVCFIAVIIFAGVGVFAYLATTGKLF